MEKYIVPDIATLSVFWAATQHHPQLAGHPLLQRDEYEKLAVPLGTYSRGWSAGDRHRERVDSYDDDVCLELAPCEGSNERSMLLHLVSV